MYNHELPEFRINDCPPFFHVGLNFAGPLLVKNNKSAESQKSYVCLLTCASTLAVHLELVESLDEEFFIRDFRRFCALRSLPLTIIMPKH